MIHIVETRYADYMEGSKQPGTLTAVASFPLELLETLLNAKESTDVPYVDIQLFWYKKSEEIIEFINMKYPPSHSVFGEDKSITTSVIHYHYNKGPKKNIYTRATFHILRRDVLQDIKEKYGEN